MAKADHRERGERPNGTKTPGSEREDSSKEAIEKRIAAGEWD